MISDHGAMPTLTTGRLTLRDWRADDADFVFDLYSRPEVQRYIGRTPTVMRSRDEADARIARWTGLHHPVHHIWAVERTADHRLLGTLLLKDIPRTGTDGAPSGETEIGWHLHPDAWGHGYAAEAGRRVLEYALAEGIDRVIAVTNPVNRASQGVCRRIGMTPLGLTEDYYDLTCALFEARTPLPPFAPH